MLMVIRELQLFAAVAIYLLLTVLKLLVMLLPAFQRSVQHVIRLYPGSHPHLTIPQQDMNLRGLIS
jgi:hypothetical protein